MDSENAIVNLTPGPALSLNLDPDDKYTAFSHVHNNHPDGTYSVFSYADLQTISVILHNDKIDTGKFVATLSTSKGTHYALTISDVAKFKKFFYHFNNDGDASNMMQYLASYNKADPLERNYYKDKTSPRISQTDTDNANVLSEFLDFLKLADMGVELFEANAAFTEFTNVYKPANSSAITRTKCEE